ncbi:MAG: hypothetical protein WHT46_08135 [Candidatus Geothermincolales bacterium]
MFRSGDRGRILPGLRAREIKVVMAMAVISLAMGFIVPVAGCGEGREEALEKGCPTLGAEPVDARGPVPFDLFGSR